MEIVSRRKFIKMVTYLGISTFLFTRSGPTSRVRAADPQGRTYVMLARTFQGDFRFEPMGLHVEPGDRVVWLQLSDYHTTTAYHPDNRKELRIPSGASSWDSGIFGLDRAELTFTYTVTVPGIYDYFCIPHELLGMVGRLVAGTVDLDHLPAYAQEAGKFPAVAEIVGRRGILFRWEARLNAPIFAAFEKRWNDVKSVTAQLLDDYRSGRNGVDILSDLLDAGAAEAFQAGLIELATAGSESEGADYNTILKLSDALKQHLRAAHR
ncbi:MAG: plastocyanin/azurin family copper-binding protein [Candidatus Bipolaricaulia bacterium]